MGRPFIPCANCASCELIFLQAGEYMENVIHVRKGSPYSLADLQNLRTTVVAWEAAAYRTLRHNTQSFIRVRTKALDSLGAPFEDYLVPGAPIGSAGGTPMGLATAFCVKFGTGLTGRSYRGRWFASAINSPQMLDAGHLSTVVAGQFASALSTLLANLSAAGHTMVVLSLRSNKVWRAAGLATPITTVLYTDTALDNQRRRLPGRGRAL